MFIEIIREAKDRLYSNYWRFMISTDTPKIKVTLWEFRKRSRRTTRCQWVSEHTYTSLDRRHNNLKKGDFIIPEDVDKELKEKLNKMVSEIEVEIR
jgi:hypothetical protein